MNYPVNVEEMRNSYSAFYIELYTLYLRTGVSYVAAATEDIFFNGNLYVSAPLARGDIKYALDNVTSEVEVQLGDINDDKLAAILNGFDFRGCQVHIDRIQYPDSLSDGNLSEPMYRGYIDAPSFADGVFSCKVKNIFPNMQAPHRTYTLPCNSWFGDEFCGMDKQRTEVVVTGVDTTGTTVYISGNYEQDKWKHGTAKINGEKRNILSSNANSIAVHINFLQDNIVGQKIILERGCDKTYETCKRYGNLARYTGFPAIPFENVYR